MDIEMDIELVFILESLNTTVGSDLQFVVGSFDDDIAENECTVGSTEFSTEPEWQFEVFQDGGERLGDISEQGGTCNIRGVEEEGASLFFTGQLYLALRKSKFGILHTYHGIADVQFLRLLFESQMEIGDMQSRSDVVDITLKEFAADAVFVCMSQLRFKMCHHIHVTIVIPAPFGFVDSLMGQMVVGGPVNTVNGDGTFVVIDFLISDGIDKQVVVNTCGVAFLDMHP